MRNRRNQHEYAVSRQFEGMVQPKFAKPNVRSAQITNPENGFVKVAALILLALGVLIAGGYAYLVFQQKQTGSSNVQSLSNFDVQNIPLTDLVNSGSLGLDTTQSLSVNGQLRANNSLVLAPTSQPTGGTVGQIYYDKDGQYLAYYDGTKFVNVAGTDEVEALQAQLAALQGTVSGLPTTQVALPAGLVTEGRNNTFTGSNAFNAGLSASAISAGALDSTSLTVSGAALLQGSLTVNGPTNLGSTTISSLLLSTPLGVGSGGTGANSFANNEIVIGQGAGALTTVGAGAAGLCLMSTAGAPSFQACPGGVGAGVTSLNTLTGGLTLANATGVGTTITINDASTAAKGIASFNAANFSVSGGAVNTIQNIGTTSSPTFAGLTLSAPLTVPSGGTGAAAFTNNGVVIGQGTAALTTVTAGGSGLCFVSTAGTPTFAACPGTGGVTSVDGLTGALNINNTSGSGTIITIDDASTTTKGIASFNSTNFTASSGAINLIQNIHTAATPTFGGLTTTGAINGQTISNAASFTGTLSVGGALSVNTITPTSGMTIGSTAQSLLLQGNATTSLSATSAGITNSLVFSTPSGSNKTITLPNAAGTVVVSASGPLAIDANGNISCPTCGISGSGVTSLNGLTGALTLNNSSGAGSSITINDATTAAKGIASFNASNFSVSGGAVNTIQDINTSAAPTFNGLSLTNALTVGNGGTGATTAAGARSNLGAAASGANSDITSLSGLTTALSIGQGGTGATTSQAAINNVSQLTTAGDLLYYNGTNSTRLARGTNGQCLTSNASTVVWGSCGLTAEVDTLATVTGRGSVTSTAVQLQGGAAIRGLTVDTATATDDQIVLAVATGGAARFDGTITASDLTANRTYTLPNASGTFAISASGPIVLDANGNISCPTCGLSGAGVTSVNGLTGALTVANASGSGATITIDDATTAAKGIASFNSTNFTVSSGAVNTIQDIATTSSPTFNALTLTTALSIGNGGTGATSASGARTNLGAAASGANSDITSLSGLTTALSIGQGGTGATTSQGAINNVSQLTTTGDLLYYNGTNSTRLARGTNGQCLTSNATTVVWGSCGLTAEADTLATVTARGSSTTTAVQLQGGAAIRGLTVDTATATDDQIILAIATGGAARFDGTITASDLTANRTYTLPNASGTIAVSASGPIVLDANGNISCPTCGVSGSGVTSLNGLTGVLSVANASGSGATITIDDATTAAKGIASFNSTNFSVSSGAVNTIQDIATTSSPTFNALTLTTALSVGNGGTGATSASGARTNLGAAASGANSDITSLSGLTTALSIGQGGTGATTSQGAINNISQLTTAGDLLYYNGTNSTRLARGTDGQCLTSNASTVVWGSCGLSAEVDTLATVTARGSVTSTGVQLQGGAAIRGLTVDTATATDDQIILAIATGGAARFDGTITASDLTANRTYTLPNASGTFAVSASGMISLDANGNITCPTCAAGGSGVTSLNGLTGALSVANASGSGATITIDDATTAAKGIASFNSTNFTVSSGAVNTIQDIATTSSPTFNALSLTTALSIGNGGTGATSASGARTNLGAAASGANSDITSLSGLTTALSIAQGGTGGTTSQAAINNVSQLTTTGDLLYYNGTNSTRLARGTDGQCLTSNATTVVWAACGAGEVDTLATVTARGSSTTTAVQLQGGAAIRGLTVDTATATDDQIILAIATGGAARFDGTITAADLTGNRTYTLPNASGTFAVSATGPITLDAAGNISCPTCTTGGGGAGGAVDSLNGLNGTLTIANASGSGATITIDDATTAAKGIASFNSTNFSVSSGAVNTIQDIATTSSPTFNALSLTTALTVGNGGTGATTAAGARSNLGAAASGANSDITSLSGLTTALSIGQGGTGSTTSQGALNNISQLTTNGDLLYYDGSNSTRLARGTNGQCLNSNATTILWGSCGLSAEVDTLATVTGRGATTSTAVFLQGGATVRGITVDTATATDDQLAFSVTGGGPASFTGTVTSADLTANRTYTLPNASGTVAVSASGNITLSSVGDITFTGVLPVSNGGTGTNTLTANGVIIGNGTSALSAVTAGAAGQCLVSTAGAPAFAACPGSGGVASLNGLTGALSINNASGSGSAITIDDATTAAKGIASFNSTNFTVSSGAVNTIQDIATTSSPTFNALTLTNALTVGNGGTGATTASGARTNLGAAASGANSDITSLSGLTTALSIGQGGTGGTTSQSAINNISQLTTTGDLLYHNGTNSTRLARGTNGQCLTSNATTVVWGSCGLSAEVDTLATVTGRGAVTSTAVQLQGGAAIRGLTVDTATATDDQIILAIATGGAARFDGTITASDLTANRTYTLPNASGTFAVSASGMISLDSNGNITCPTCGASGAGVTSLNGLTGALSVANASGSGATITIDDATTAAKGIASFNSTNFTVTSGAVNTIQDIATTSSPTFNALSLTTALTIGNGGTGATTAAGARTNLGAAASGANSDITSLSGLTTALSIGQGGTGATTSQGAIDALSQLTTNGDLLYYNGTNSTRLARGTNGECLTSNATTLIWGSCGLTTEADTLASVTGRGATTSTAVLLQGGATSRGLTIDTATATDDLIAMSVTTGGAARFTGTITSADLDAARTWTLPNESGTFCLQNSANCGFALSSGGSAYIQNQNAGQQATSNFWISGTGRADTALQAPTFDTATAGALTLGGTNATSISVQDNVTLAAGLSLTVTGGNTASRPGSPTEGMVYYDTTTKQLLVYANGKWQADRTTATKIVAANDSQNKDAADYVVSSADETAGNADAQIQAAINALPANGGTVYLMEGTYTIDTSIAPNTKTRLVGAGPSTIIKLKNSINAAFNAISVSSKHEVVIRDLTIDGNKANNSSGTQNGILTFASGSATQSGTTVEGVTLSNFRNQGVDITNGKSTKVTNSSIFSNDGDGITFNGATEVAVTHNTISSNLGDGVSALGDSSIVSNNTMRSNGKGVYVQGASYVTISGNEITASTETNSGAGIDMWSAGDHNLISGNTISGGASWGISVRTNSDYATVTGNNVSGNAIEGIFFTSSDYGMISNNKVHNNGSTGAYDGIELASATSNTTVLNNYITDTAGTGYAIRIPSTAPNNTLSGNVYSGTGASSISDVSTTTIWTNQHDDKGAIINKNVSALTIATTTVNGTLSLQGGITATALPAPAAPTIGRVGTTGATSYSYAVAALDGTGETLVSSNGTSATSNATLTGVNYNTITWTKVPGATSYKIYRTASAGSPATTGLIGTVATSGTGSTQVFNDTGLAASGSTPAANTTGGATFAGLLQGTSATLTGANSLTVGTSSSSTGSIIFKNSTNANSITLVSGVATSAQTVTLGDESGTICLQNSANCGFLTGVAADGDYIQNQNAGQQATSNFWISGTGRADTALQAPTFDTATAGALTLGGTNATSISVQDNVTLAAGLSLTVTGGNTASRPGSPTEGMVYYDTDTKQLLTYANGKWQADRTTATKIVGTSASGGASSAVASQSYDAADFVNTSTTSAQTAINSAISALPAAGGTVYLMEGTYIVDGGITLPSNVTLTGAGSSTVIKIKNATNATLTILASNATSNVTIENLVLEGNKANNSSGTQMGIDRGSSAVSGFKVNNVTVQNFRDYGLLIRSGTDTTVTNSSFNGNTSSGLYNQAGTYATFANNTAASNSSYGFQIAGNYNSITGNTARSNSAAGILVSNGYSTATGNVAISNNIGIHLSASNITASGNTVSANGVGIYMAANSLTVTSNVVVDNTGHGIELGSISDSVVDGNRVINNGGSGSSDGISVQSSSLAQRNSITNNLITDTAGTGYAINLVNSNTRYTLLSGNTFSGTGASSINDIGLYTSYAAQRTPTQTLQSSSSLFKGSTSANLTGTAAIAATTAITGTSTLFTTELQVGDRVTINSETRTVTVITSNTSATVDTAFTTTVSGQTVARLPAILVVRDSSNNTKLTVDNTGALNVWGGTLTLGTSSQAGAFSISDGSSNTVTLQSSAQSGNYTLSIPTMAANDTICLQSLANCGGGGGVTTVGAIDGGVYSANGASISGTTIYLQTASATQVGLVTTGSQVFAGNKTFNGTLTVNDTVVAAGKSLTITGGNTASRPASPTEGMIYYDTTTKQQLTYANGKWQADRAEAVLVAASNSSDADKAAADYVADGTDDQVEINAALTAANPSSGSRKSGKVYLFAGTYTTHQTNNGNATILIPNNVTLAGAGTGTVIRLGDIDATDNLIENSDTSTGTGVVIRDLKLDGQDSLNTAGSQNGVYFDTIGNGTAQGARMVNVEVKDFRDIGIVLDNSANNVVERTTSHSSAYGISISWGSTNNTITGNKFQNNSSTGMYLNDGTYNTITSNNLLDNGSGGVNFESSSQYNTFTANTLRGNGGNSIRVASSHNTISGNTIYANGDAISFSGGTYNTVNGNNVDGSGGAGVGFRLESSANNNNINGNNFRNTGGTTTNDAIYVDASDGNTITNNGLSDGSCTTNCYAINIVNSTSDNTYLSGNTLGGGSINDAGTGTIYNGQTNSSGNYLIQSTGSIELMKDTNLAGNLTVAAGKSIVLMGGNTASRPASPTEGMVYYDTDTKQLLTYANGKWQSDSKTATFIVAASNSSQAAKDGAQYVANGEDSSGSGIGTLDGDQVQINNALTAASSAGGGIVYLTEGTYTIDAAISIPNNVTLAGSGVSTLIQMGNFGGTSTSINMITNSDTTTGTGVTIRDLKLDGRRSINTAGTQRAIYLNNMGDNASPYRKGATVKGVTAVNVRTEGIYLTASDNNIVTGNVSNGHGGSGITVSFTANQNTISDNITQGNAANGINVWGVNSTVTGNISRENTGAGFDIEGTGSSVTGNTSAGNTQQGFLLYFVSGVTLTGNTARDNADSGLYLSTGSTDNMVNGNTFTDNGGSTNNNGIVIGASDTNSVVNNVIMDSSASTTNYAIKITSGTSNYLSGNRLGNSATINDAGTTTVYANQMNSSGALVQRASGGLTVQNSAGNDIFGVDTSAGTALLGKSSSVDGKLVVRNATNSNTITLQTGATSSSYTLTLPTTLGSSGQCLSLTGVAGSVGTLGWGACTGGGGSSAKKITLTPEYAGAVLRADGTNNNGTMTTDFLSGLGSGAGYKHTFYEWSTSQATAQDYDIIVTHQLPSDFNATTEFDAGSWKVWTYVDNNTDASLTMTVYDADETACASGVSIEGAGTGWTQITMTDFDTNASCDFAADGIITIKITVTSKSPNTNKVRVGEIQYGYTN